MSDFLINLIICELVKMREVDFAVFDDFYFLNWELLNVDGLNKIFSINGLCNRIFLDGCLKNDNFYCIFCHDDLFNKILCYSFFIRILSDNNFFIKILSDNNFFNKIFCDYLFNDGGFDLGSCLNCGIFDHSLLFNLRLSQLLHHFIQVHGLVLVFFLQKLLLLLFFLEAFQNGHFIFHFDIILNLNLDLNWLLLDHAWFSNDGFFVLRFWEVFFFDFRRLVLKKLLILKQLLFLFKRNGYLL